MAEKLTVIENKFEVPFNIAANGKVEKTLQTAGKFVDKDIHIEINTPDASYKVNANPVPVAVASIAANDYTTETENDHAIVLQADASKAASEVGIDQAGFSAADDVISVPAVEAERATKTVYIKEGKLAGSTATEITSENVKFASDSNAFDITAKASGKINVTKAGWIDAGTEADAASEKTIHLQAASLSNNEANAADFELKEAPVLTEDGYLFIKEGYIKDTKISLATLVPDNANITSENADKVYNTVKAYDKDGKLIVGTMGDASLSAITANNATATVATVQVAANADNSKFAVTGSQAIAGTTHVEVASRGLAETSLHADGVISGTANVAAEIDVIALNATVAGDGAVKPVIKKGEATALSGAIATVAPEGKHYVSVSADAITKTATVTPVVSEAGYGTAALHKATTASVTAGTVASDTFFIGIDDGNVTSVATNGADAEKTIVVTSSCEAVGGEVNMAGVLDVAPASGKYITLKAASNAPEATVTGSVVTTVVEGYVTEAKTNTKNVVANFSTVAGSDAQYIAVYDGELI